MDLPKEPTLQALVRTEPVFSTKALVADTLGSLCIAVGAPYGNMVIRGSYMSIDFSAAGALYYATPENEWALLILPHLPEWITPQDPEAIK